MSAGLRSFSIFSSERHRLRDLLLALALGCALYLLVFGFVVHKPLTVGVTAGYIAYKQHYLASLGARPKIVILAGSNGRFSHRCEEIARISGVACANLSVSADLSLSWQFRKYAAALHDGDVLYLPLEYYPAERRGAEELAQPRAGGEAPYVVAYDKRELFDYTPRQALDALFGFDLKYLFSGLGEMALAAAGKERRFSLKTLTANGDERGHTAARAEAYRSIVARMAGPLAAPLPRYLQVELEEIFRQLRGSGVIVVGGLPTTFDDVVLPAAVVDARRAFFRAHGGCFIALPGRSLYPRTLFYDNAYHLVEDAQLAHSRALAPLLGAIASTRRCPPPLAAPPARGSFSHLSGR